MENRKDLDRGEGKDRADQELSAELESLYRDVAQSDKPGAQGKGNVYAQRANNDREVNDLTVTGGGPRYLTNQAEMMEKLAAITEAYEKILTYWPYAPERPRRSDTGDTSQ